MGIALKLSYLENFVKVAGYSYSKIIIMKKSFKVKKGVFKGLNVNLLKKKTDMSIPKKSITILSEKESKHLVVIDMNVFDVLLTEALQSREQKVKEFVFKLQMDKKIKKKLKSSGEEQNNEAGQEDQGKAEHDISVREDLDERS